MGRVNRNRINRACIMRFSEHAELDPFSLSGQSAMALLEELTSTSSVVSGGDD